MNSNITLMKVTPNEGKQRSIGEMCIALNVSWFLAHYQKLVQQDVSIHLKGSSGYKRAFSVDIYIPEWKLAIEHNGHQHATDEGVRKDQEKREWLRCAGIQLITIYDHTPSERERYNAGHQFVYQRSDVEGVFFKALGNISQQLCMWISQKYGLQYFFIPDFILQENYQTACWQKKLLDSRATHKIYWLGDKNHQFLSIYSSQNIAPPYLYQEGSGKAVYWKCPHCHKEFVRTIANMTRGSIRCPLCKKTLLSK